MKMAFQMTKLNDQNNMNSGKSASGTIQRVFSLALMLVAVTCCGYMFSMKYILEKEAREALTEKKVTEIKDLIEGNYEVRFDYADSTVRFTGTVSRDINEAYVFTILSEYSPRVITLDICDDGVIRCDELGEGTMSYIEDIDKTSIKFEKENFTCTLTK